MPHPGRIYTKQQIFEYAWEGEYIADDSTIMVHISNLRRKLKETGGKDYIEAVWGIGFKLAEP